MSDLIGCLAFLWAGAVIVGLVMVEWRLSRMQRMMARHMDLAEQQAKTRMRPDASASTVGNPPTPPMKPR